MAKSDPSIDDDYFAYIFTLLVRHPSIKVSISNVPLAAQDKTVRLGDAPLPEDYEAPSAVREDVDITQMYRQGVKGRALAYHLFGQESKTSKQVAEEKRAEYDRHRLKGGKSSIFKATKKDRQNLKEVEEELIRDIKADDGGGIARSDLDGLSVRWGSRLRVRCTDDEIYFRLTGSRVKVRDSFNGKGMSAHHLESQNHSNRFRNLTALCQIKGEGYHNRRARTTGRNKSRQYAPLYEDVDRIGFMVSTL